MDDIVVRPRYQRYKTNRRRKRYSRNSNEYSQKIALQVLICLIILAVCAVVRYVDTPVTNYLEDKASSAVMQDIELKGFYDAIDSLVTALTKGSSQNKADEIGFDEAALPVSTQSESLLGAEYDNTEDSLADENNSRLNQEDDKAAVPSTKTSRSDTDNPETMYPSAGIKMLVPVSGPIGSPFGERIHPIRKEESFHRGIDIEANKGAPIKAVLAGEVIDAGTEKTLGNYIKVRHTGGFTSVYAHCSKIISKKGQKVKQGEIIAHVGNTGASVGAHLHLEIWKDGTAIDPQLYIDIPAKS